MIDENVTTKGSLKPKWIQRNARHDAYLVILKQLPCLPYAYEDIFDGQVRQSLDRSHSHPNCDGMINFDFQHGFCPVRKVLSRIRL